MKFMFFWGFLAQNVQFKLPKSSLIILKMWLDHLNHWFQSAVRKNHLWRLLKYDWTISITNFRVQLVCFWAFSAAAGLQIFAMESISTICAKHLWKYTIFTRFQTRRSISHAIHEIALLTTWASKNFIFQFTKIIIVFPQVEGPEQVKYSDFFLWRVRRSWTLLQLQIGN